MKISSYKDDSIGPRVRQYWRGKLLKMAKNRKGVVMIKRSFTNCKRVMTFK